MNSSTRNKKTENEPTNQHLTNGKPVDSVKTSDTQSSENKPANSSTRNKKTENAPTNQHLTNGKSVDTVKTSDIQSSENTPAVPLPAIYRAAVYDLPARLQSKRSLIDILKDFPNVKYINIYVLVSGVAHIISKDPQIVSKLRVLKVSIKEPIVITLLEPKKPYVKSIKKSSDKNSGTKPETDDKSQKIESDRVIPKAK